MADILATYHAWGKDYQVRSDGTRESRTPGGSWGLCGGHCGSDEMETHIHRLAEQVYKLKREADAMLPD